MTIHIFDQSLSSVNLAAVRHRVQEIDTREEIKLHIYTIDRVQFHDLYSGDQLALPIPARDCVRATDYIVVIHDEPLLLRVSHRLQTCAHPLYDTISIEVVGVIYENS